MKDVIKEASDSGWVSEHRAQYLQDGEAGHIFDTARVGGPGPVPTLLLYTRGRRSGRESIMPLAYGEVDGGYVLIASKAGYPRHPGWFHNLLAQQKVKIKLKNEFFEATARVAEGEDRERLWAHMVGMYPPYEDYQKWAGDRLIPVIVCERL